MKIKIFGVISLILLFGCSTISQSWFFGFDPDKAALSLSEKLNVGPPQRYASCDFAVFSVGATAAEWKTGLCAYFPGRFVFQEFTQLAPPLAAVASSELVMIPKAEVESYSIQMPNGLAGWGAIQLKRFSGSVAVFSPRKSSATTDIEKINGFALTFADSQISVTPPKSGLTEDGRYLSGVGVSGGYGHR